MIFIHLITNIYWTFIISQKYRLILARIVITKKKQRRKTINIIPRSLITEPQLKPRNHSKDKKLWPLKGSLNSSTILVSYSLDALKSIFLKGGWNSFQKNIKDVFSWKMKTDNHYRAPKLGNSLEMQSNHIIWQVTW